VSADRLLIQAGCAAQMIYQNTPRLVTKAVGASHRIPALDMAHAAGVGRAGEAEASLACTGALCAVFSVYTHIDPVFWICWDIDAEFGSF
jgi:hypothetical protein